MSTPNLTLYNLEATLMRLMFEREELAAEGLSVIEKDVEIREYVSKEIRKVDGVAYYLKEFEARAVAAKEEAKRLKARADAWEQRHERLETLVKSVMLMSGKARLDGDSNTLRLVKCPASVEIVQPELVPDEMQQVNIRMPLIEWRALVMLAAHNGFDAAPIHACVVKAEPVKSKIAEALKQQVRCPACAGTGDVNSGKCGYCHDTGKVNQGVPGCSLVTDKMSLRVE